MAKGSAKVLRFDWSDFQLKWWILDLFRPQSYVLCVNRLPSPRQYFCENCVIFASKKTEIMPGPRHYFLEIFKSFASKKNGIMPGPRHYS